MMAAVKAPGLDWIKVVFSDHKSYDDICKHVGGYIELVPNFYTKAILYCNEEGKMNGLPPNFPLLDPHGSIIDIIAGTVVMMGPCDGEGNETELTDELFEQTKHYFGG